MDSIQESFLTQLAEKKMPVTLFLVNGFQYRGVIRDFDKFTISIEADGNQFLIFKKMVSTIQTQTPIVL
jgi:host factor-I protein